MGVGSTLCGLGVARIVDVFEPSEASCRECKRRYEIALPREQERQARRQERQQQWMARWLEREDRRRRRLLERERWRLR